MIKDIDLEKYDTIGKMFSLFLKASIAIGFIVLIFYLLMNSAYPENMSLGDGILFVVIAGVFGAIYLLFVSSLTAVGTLPFSLKDSAAAIARILFQKKFKWRLIKHYVRKHFDTFLATFGLSILGGYIVYLFILGAVKEGDLRTLIAAIGVPLASAYIWRSHQALEQKVRRLNLRISNTKNQLAESATEVPITLQRQPNRFTLVLLLLAVPLPLGFGLKGVTNATMRAVNIREENVSIHIKEPYVTYMKEHRFEGKESPFKGGYLKYENFTLVMQNIGENVFLRSNDGQELVVKIPKSHIMIVPILEEDEKNENIGETVPD